MNLFPDAAAWSDDRTYEYTCFKHQNDHKHYDRYYFSAFKIVAYACKTERIIKRVVKAPEENIHKMSIAFTVNTAANTAEEAEAAAGGRKALSVILSVRNLVDAIIKAHNENIIMTGIIMWTARHSVSVVRKAE